MKDVTVAVMQVYQAAGYVYDAGMLAYWMRATTTASSGEWHTKELDEQIARLEDRIAEYKAARAKDLAGAAQPQSDDEAA